MVTQSKGYFALMKEITDFSGALLQIIIASWSVTAGCSNKDTSEVTSLG